MRQRLIPILGVVAALVGVVVIVLLMLQDTPRPYVEKTVQPPETMPAPPPDPEQAQVGHGTLRGKVVDGRNDKPLAGAVVEALIPYERKLEGEELPLWGALRKHKAVRTGEDGTFAVEDLPPNYWNLWVERRGYAWTTVPRAKFDETHVIRLYPECGVHGKVVFPDGTPAPGCRVEYTPQGTHSEVFGRYATKGLESHYSTTREDGTFEYRGLPPGKFTVEVFPTEHLPAPWTHEPPLKPGEYRDLGTHKLDVGFTMTVTVKWRGTDRGVPGIEVKAVPVGDPMPRTKIGQRRRTDADGVARFQGLGGQVMPNPTFMVTANVEGVGPVMPDGGGLLQPGQNITIYLRKEGVVKGRVVGPDGQPLKRFFVDLEAVGHRTIQLRTSGELGAFARHGVPEGTYDVHIRHKQFVDAVRRVTAVGGEEVDLGVVTLQGGAEVYGTVRRSGGEALEGVVQVRLARKRADGRGYTEMAQDVARADGSYRISGVPPGVYYLQPDWIENPSSTTDPVRVEIKAGTGAIQRDLVLHGEGFLVLKFVDLIEGQLRHVSQPVTYLVDEESGREMRWFGEGTRLRAGNYAVSVELKDEAGVLQRYSVKTVRVQEGERTDPIEVRLFEIRNGKKRDK